MEESYSESMFCGMSPDIRRFGEAFLRAKERFGALEKNGKNQKWDYARLEDVYNTVERALAANGIVIWHFRSVCGDKEVMHTRLTHVSSGQFIQDSAILHSEKPGNQGHGNACTYMKRYALLSLCALGGDPRDDDGAAEQDYINSKAYKISVEQLKYLQGLIKDSVRSRALYNEILNGFKINDLADLHVSEYENVVRYININKE